MSRRGPFGNLNVPIVDTVPVLKEKVDFLEKEVERLNNCIISDRDSYNKKLSVQVKRFDQLLGELQNKMSSVIFGLSDSVNTLNVEFDKLKLNNPELFHTTAVATPKLVTESLPNVVYKGHTHALMQPGSLLGPAPGPLGQVSFDSARPLRRFTHD